MWDRLEKQFEDTIWLTGIPVPKNTFPQTFEYGDTTYMLLDESHLAPLRSMILGTSPKAELISLYKAFALHPKDFGSAHKDWTSWQIEHAGPEVNGVTLTGREVKMLRTALQTARAHGVTGLPSYYRAVLIKCGIQPQDILSTTITSWN